jgi:hypothetical protein
MKWVAMGALNWIRMRKNSWFPVFIFLVTFLTGFYIIGKLIPETTFITIRMPVSDASDCSSYHRLRTNHNNMPK